MPCILMHWPALTPASFRACLMRRLTPRGGVRPGGGSQEQGDWLESTEGDLAKKMADASVKDATLSPDVKNHGPI